MEKALVFVLFFWYLLLSGGVVASTHMCQNMLGETLLLGLSGEEAKACPQCTSEDGSHSGDCCEYVDIVTPSNKVQKFSQKELGYKDIKASLPLSGNEFVAFRTVSVTENQTFHKEFFLRPVSKTSIHILHCVYRI